MRFARQWLPPALRHAGNRLLGTAIGYSGPFETWAEALRATAGYADEAILARVIAATEAVLAGHADYEQDGIPMHGTPPPGHALPSLLAAARDGTLRVVDFGGGLASHYLRWLPLLKGLDEIDWCVVEQPHFVESGRRLFLDVPQVRFVSNIEEASTLTPDAVLASSVLQYLESPLDTLHGLASLGARAIVLDRTPFATDGHARILAQRTPAKLGRASYPLWVLSANAVDASLQPDYVRRLAFPGNDHPITVGKLRADYSGGTWWRT